MDKFEVKLRGIHTKAVENIMNRTSCIGWQSKTKRKINCDNITTYLRKYQINKENHNLAKRILFCQSEHNFKYYQKQWEKIQNYLRIRSNFKKNLCIQQPKITKLQPLLGRGKESCLVTLSINKFQSSSVYFHHDVQYQIKILYQNHEINPINSTFTLSTICNNKISFSISQSIKKRKIKLNIIEKRQNEIYEKGKLYINLSTNEQQNINVFNKQKKIIAMLNLVINKQYKNNKQDLSSYNKKLNTTTTNNQISFLTNI